MAALECARLRESFLVVTVLKPVLRGVSGRRAGCKSRLRPARDWVSVLVIGNWLGLQISKPDDGHVNANGEKFVLLLCYFFQGVFGWQQGMIERTGHSFPGRLFAIQPLRETVCATFCATFIARQKQSMITGKK